VAYFPATSAALDSVGVLQDVRAQGVICDTLTQRSLDGTLLTDVAWGLVQDQTPHNYMLLGQNSVCQILSEHLARLKNVDIRWGRRVTSVKQDNAGVHLRWESAQGTGEIRAPWVVGADGARSLVREQLGIPFEGITWPERFVAANVFYDFALHGYSRAQFIVDPVDWAVIVQIDKTGLWRVCYGEDASISEEEVRARQPARFKRILPGAPNANGYRVDLCTPYRVHQRSAATYRQGRALLVADAAHATNPIGGLGLSGGIIDADQLGVALAAVVKGEAPDSILDAWAQKRRRVFLEYTSPTASENKRRISEADPERRAADAKMMAHVNGQADLQRRVLLDTMRLTGD
jgi:2-polyprenyl-6-methoxyphenol hydroxylase-like FAD-dependent oxidoreductase